MQRDKIDVPNRVYVTVRDLLHKRAKSVTAYDTDADEVIEMVKDAIDREERRGKRKDAKP